MSLLFFQGQDVDAPGREIIVRQVFESFGEVFSFYPTGISELDISDNPKTSLLLGAYMGRMREPVYGMPLSTFYDPPDQVRVGPIQGPGPAILSFRDGKHRSRA